MSRESVVAETLARRLTDEQSGACAEDVVERAVCGTHSSTTVQFRLPPGGECMQWRGTHRDHLAAMEWVVGSEEAKILLLEVWDA